jgi:regulator of protease activity HflC (stomatin/prohibitin superfamily)
VISKIAGGHVALEAFLIREVELPAAIRAVIDQKVATEQEVLKMRYALEIARASAAKKHVEAQAVADYYRTVAPSLSPTLLEFERIQQLTQLAGSVNAKTVLIGTGASSAPVMISTPAAAR